MMITQSSVKLIRVFLASPGDVAGERETVAELLDSLQNSPAWRTKLKFDIVRWEKPGSGAPMLAHMTPQEAIAAGRPKPSGCDIVIVIFWSRMGTPLPESFDVKPDGALYESGTEWEFWDAVSSAEQNAGHPRVLLYRRNEEPPITLRDAQRDMKLAQWDKVERFFASLTDADGSIRYSHTAYELTGFEQQLRSDLEAVLTGLLGPDTAVSAEMVKLPDNSTPRSLPPVFNQLLQQVLESFRTTVSTEEAGLALMLTPYQLGAIREHSVQDNRQYHLSRIAEWSQPRYQLDKRFTPLTLLLFQKEQGYMEQPQVQVTDLRQLFVRQPDVSAFVVLGAPGSGKSTLLRRLELDLACDALCDSQNAAAASVVHKNSEVSQDTAEYLSFYLSLNNYQGASGAEPPVPQDWLEQNWSAICPDLPTLPEVLQNQRVVFLLDALNEMPHRDFSQFQQRVADWQSLIRHYAQVYPRCRFVFSCRTLDYSSTLSGDTLIVPHVRIEQLSAEQIKAFLTCYAPEQAEDLFNAIERQQQLGLYSTPYFLKLLIEQAQRSGKVPDGRAALFTGFVRAVLEREYRKANPLILADGLLNERELKKLALQVGDTAQWATEYALPEQGALFRELARLAYSMQERGIRDETAQVSIDLGEALECVQCAEAEKVLEAGIALGILDEDRRNDRIQFMHQLLQEYFAARCLARRPDPERVRSVWQADQTSPSLDETLAELADYEPLPPPRTTGWEETTLMAAAMAADSDAYLRALAEVNLPLAGQAATQDGLVVNGDLKAEFQTRLIARCEDSTADVRHRIAAGRALGELGDPRFVENQGEFGRYLLPPMVNVPCGIYRIGSDEGLFNDEAPVHETELEAFQLGQFAVTNAEYACFIEAGGYEDERWWQGEGALAWFRGETTADGPRQQEEDNRKLFQERLDDLPKLHEQGRITSKQLEGWQTIAGWSDERFNEWLDDLYPGGKQQQPSLWSNSAYNHPQQPVVGICWFEAEAYCQWLSEQTGIVYTLPSEVQWEVAARGESHRRYAWGDDFDAARCNTFESHIRGTNPVGIFPDGVATLQPIEEAGGCVADTALANTLHEMNGNVWEWTTTVYQSYPYRAEDGREDQHASGEVRRVLRGGSWNNNWEYARAARRGRNLPTFRLNNVGFRLCCAFSPPI